MSPAGMEPLGSERHRRSPRRGEFSGERINRTFVLHYSSVVVKKNKRHDAVLVSWIALLDGGSGIRTKAVYTG